MPKPPLPELFASSLDGVTPSKKRNGPRLWVRRLMIWSEPGKVIRDVSLRPGLNVIWSPDADRDGHRMGHGGGKTSFCRLLRYCLGEDSFGTHDQRQLIASVLPLAYVGAEVILDGDLWIVARPVGNSRSSHFAQEGGVLDTAYVGGLANTGMMAFRKAVAEAIMPNALPHMPVGSSADDAWEAALAWITRDQECRLLNILDWRAPETQSGSPSRNMSRADRLRVVRLLINALQPSEIEALRRAQGHAQAAAQAARRLERIEWVRDDVGRGLAQVFGGDPNEPDTPDFWSHNASAAAQAEEAQIDPEIASKLDAARHAVREKEAAIIERDKRLAVIDAELSGQNELLRVLNSELPRAELRVQDVANPKCLSCGQPIRATEQAFIAERRAERDDLAKQQADAVAKQNALRAEQDQLNYWVAADRQEVDRRKTTLVGLENAAREASERLAAAKGYVTMTARYRSYESEIVRARRDMQKEQEAEAKARLKAAEYRHASQNVVERLSRHFDAIVRFLIPEGAQGDVRLAEDGIHPRVSLHGNLKTAAVDSLKVVAFDLAALILTMEDKTQLPSFWLHDSPREADLGLPLYHRLFGLALQLEGLTETPLFQYVVTTTTEPPAALQTVPWLALQLSSAPADMRLFKRDL